MTQRPLLSDAVETSHRPAYNIKRRTDHGSLLLQSPARQGHHDRMRRIFEDAGQTVSVSHHKEKLRHPLVLDTSQPASSLQTEQQNSDISISVNQPQRSCGRAILGIENLHSEPTEHTADSWSDDSGYLYTESQLRLRAVGSSAQRIQQWLSNVALEPLAHAEGRPSQLPQYFAVSESERSIHRPHTHVEKPSSKHDNILSPRGANQESSPAKPTQHEHNHGTSFHSLTDLASTEDPFVTRDSEHLSLQPFIPSISSNVREWPEIKTATPAHEMSEADEKEPELVPLSPNVCIERRRKSRRRSLVASP
ncbi:hypothetical protein GRF29_1g3120899 [Pseudopithomyces chartarum]|uniref:Uncharacterized protein n=1 Tax=Pseudopithomyces chartarum TaxID=1892770 RepID=A0AAN6RLB3_9PLEO|nr:hypothetical protein GRF29_1g3120899 [Pseudopithomyces chartarum]